MEQVLKIFNTLFAAFDRIIESIDVRTKTMIRQFFFLFIVVGCIAGLVIGISMGRQAADKGGVQMIEKTNDAFDIDINRERERVTFKGMVDSTSIVESGKKEIQKAELEAPQIKMIEQEDILEKDEPKTVNIMPSENTMLTKPVSPDQEEPIESETATLPAVEAETNSEILMSETDKLLPQESEQTDSTTMSNTETTDADNWKPSGEMVESPENIVPMKKDEDILE